MGCANGPVRVDASRLMTRRGHVYRISPGLLQAVNAAFFLERPLLVTGPPGSGKTELAWSLAHFLHQEGLCGRREPGLCQVRSDTRARDLLYHNDMLGRFADSRHTDEAILTRARDPRKYIHLKPLGAALWGLDPGVVLIDELDKASRDVPNDLLDVLDKERHGQFEIVEVPEARGEWARVYREVEARRAALSVGDSEACPDADDTTIQRHMAQDWDALEARRLELGRLLRPFVLITSNEERHLPEPFLRRCVFYHIPFFGPNDRLAILAEHLGEARKDELETINQVFSLLLKNSLDLKKHPGLTELIDWARVLLDDQQTDHAKLKKLAEKTDPFSVDWKDVPYLGCLVKMKEDLKTIRVIEVQE